MRTVNVSSFDIEIASVDSLLLSLDGEKWGTTVAINESNYNHTDVIEDGEKVTYPGNTNSWGDPGLIPMSTVGEMDIASSRMKIFEKASLTATPGGYRLMSSRVNNYEANNQRGYVVFDLFVKNLSGTQYINGLNELDEEAVYLTINSEVKVAEGGGVSGTGIENSVRVAFAQIGRVAGTTTDVDTITGITCTSSTNDNPVTGICRTAQIWEPNDTSHVKNAISWYDTACKKRTGLDVTKTTSYGGSCMPVVDGIAYPTYAVSGPIASSDNVDVYDGLEYNTYYDKDSNPILKPYPFYTDTDKLLRGTSRAPFMTFAPNSITKVRIYVYIEGQDIDNYDFASIGKKISVNFGFTKERFTEDDIDYDGEDLNEGDGPFAADKTPPVITITGANPTVMERLAIDSETGLPVPFDDLGATVKDNKDGTTLTIKASGTVNTSIPGTYKITYKAVDAAGNVGIKTRTVIVQEPQTP
ncbi:MAG: DUF5011 domain-containing protein [Thomasclavelia sp.]|nr:DUF5011 domain-containing protein [Thomasclavelia sp.]